MKTKYFLSFLSSILISLFVGVTAAAVLPVNPLAAAATFFTAKTVHLFFTEWNTGAIFMAGVNKEIWIDKLKENFFNKYEWLSGVQDWSEWVEYNTINFAISGANPTILKNNVTWPIVAAQRTDTAGTVVLDTYDSTTTRVRDLEEVETSYSKLESVIRQHKDSLLEAIVTECLWNYSPATLALGAFSTTGALRAVAIGIQDTAAKKMTIADVATIQERWDVLNLPQEGRVLVLNPYHRNDLMNADVSLFKEFTNLKKGEALPMFGIDVYTAANTPVYAHTTLAKAAYGAAPAAATDCVASVAFIQGEVMKAMGSMDMYYKEKEINPEQRADEVGFRMRFKGVPQRTTANYQIAVVSDRA